MSDQGVRSYTLGTCARPLQLTYIRVSALYSQPLVMVTGDAAFCQSNYFGHLLLLKPHCMRRTYAVYCYT